MYILLILAGIVVASLLIFYITMARSVPESQVAAKARSRDPQVALNGLEAPARVAAAPKKTGKR
jgi:hypothetical protein